MAKYPNFVRVNPIRLASDPRLGSVLRDIDGQMPAGHIYKDPDLITWGHETSHGIASRLRNGRARSMCLDGYAGSKPMFVPHPFDHDQSDRVVVSKPDALINAFYLLNNDAIFLDEPAGRLSDVANEIPASLRGDVYQLYLKEQQASWNDRPLYVVDEWVAYANGSLVRWDLDIKERGETLKFMLEFVGYAFGMVKATNVQPGSDIHNFVIWHAGECVRIWRDSSPHDGANAWFERMKSSEWLRDIAGPLWSASNLDNKMVAMI